MGVERKFREGDESNEVRKGEDWRVEERGTQEGVRHFRCKEEGRGVRREEEWKGRE